MRVDEAIVVVVGGVVVKAPKNRSSVRMVAIDAATLDELRVVREERHLLADACGVVLADDGFVFSAEPSGEDPPNPDVFTNAFTRCRDLAGVATDVHLHSLRHFQSTRLDNIISEAQKQARMGWASVHMARHYTDAVSEEDRRAADHMARRWATQQTETCRSRDLRCRLARRRGVGSHGAFDIAGDQAFKRPADDPIAAVDREHGHRQVVPFDGTVERRPTLAKEFSGLLHAQQWHRPLSICGADAVVAPPFTSSMCLRAPEIATP